MRDAYTGAPNPLRSACLDEMGESLMAFCRAMRAAADEVDPSVMLATCLSVSQYDLDGVDVPQMIRLLAGKGKGRPFVRPSGATYWVCHASNARNWGQGLGGVIEYLRWQAAMLRAERIATLFQEAAPVGFEVFAPPHLVREATLPASYTDMKTLLKFFAQPQAGILLAANGAPTRYDRNSGAPLAVFGPAAATLPKEWLSRGVLIDRDSALILQSRVVDTGLDAKEGVSRVDGWNLYTNAQGEKFAVSEKGWYDLDGREASPTPVPVRAIWKFFTGKEIPIYVEGAKGLHLLAKRRPDGSMAVLVNNLRGGAVGPFALSVSGTLRLLALLAYGCRILQVNDAEN